MIKKIDKENAIVAYKAFGNNFSCRDFQYEVGKEYHINGDVEVCKKGFHACIDLMDVFDYYSMSNSRFAIVKMWGDVLFDIDKICASNIEIVEELSLKDIVERYASSKLDFMNKTYHDCIILRISEMESYTNGDGNHIISNHNRKKILSKGVLNTIISNGVSNTIFDLGDFSTINCNDIGTRLVSIGCNKKITLMDSSTAVLYGDKNTITGLSDGSVIVSNGNDCTINLISNSAHCTTNGRNNKINVMGNNIIDSRGFGDELILNGNDITFRAKYGSAVTCMGKETMLVGDGSIKEDVWYRFANGNIKYYNMMNEREKSKLK